MKFCIQYIYLTTHFFDIYSWSGILRNKLIIILDILFVFVVNFITVSMNSADITAECAKIADALLLIKEVNKMIRKRTSNHTNPKQSNPTNSMEIDSEDNESLSLILQQEFAFDQYQDLMSQIQQILEKTLAHAHRNLEWFRYNLKSQHMVQTCYVREQLTKLLPSSHDPKLLDPLIEKYLNTTTTTFPTFEGDDLLEFGQQYYMRLRTASHVKLEVVFLGLDDPEKHIAKFDVHRVFGSKNSDYSHFLGKQLIRLDNIYKVEKRLLFGRRIYSSSHIAVKDCKQ